MSGWNRRGDTFIEQNGNTSEASEEAVGKRTHLHMSLKVASMLCYVAAVVAFQGFLLSIVLLGTPEHYIVWAFNVWYVLTFFIVFPWDDDR